MKSIQSSKLLPALFEHLNEQQRITVLNIGPAQPEMLEFFSAFRCKLHFADLFSELPFLIDEEKTADFTQQFSTALALPDECQLDLCLFWDIFNYLTPPAVTALLQALSPHFGATTRAHGFAMHKLKGPQGNQLYGLNSADSIIVRNRSNTLPGYSPHGQAALKTLLRGLNIERSVLLSDGRLELLFNTAS